jgi:hypothetical protein
VPFDQALAQLAHACQWNWGVGQLLPLSFVAWREWICGDSWTALVETPPADPPRPGADISDNLRGWLYLTCYELLDLDEFVSWSLSSAEIDKLGTQYRRLAKEHGEPLDAGLLRALLCQGVEQAMDAHFRARLQKRLYRIAPLLRELYEREDVWQCAMVAADALSEESPYPWQEHPLLLGMVGHSLQLVVDRDIDWSIAL